MKDIEEFRRVIQAAFVCGFIIACKDDDAPAGQQAEAAFDKWWDEVGRRNSKERLP